MGVLASIAALLGVSAYARPAQMGLGLDDPSVEQVREAFGGQLQPQPATRTRWYLPDVESAEFEADSGSLMTAAQLMRSARRDGVLAGVLSTRTSGVVRLPKRFSGPVEQVAALELRVGSESDSARSVFDEMFPPAELALLAADDVLLGVGVAEMLPVAGRDYPVMVRLDPEFLVYRWTENRWYFRSVAGLLPITPGDGRWILHVPGGRSAPWQHGLWRAISRAFIRKEHALLHKDNWEGKLANPARVAVAPQGATEAQKESWFRRVMAWGVNTVFGMTPGYDVKLLESNGRGHESFDKTVADQDREMVIAVAGQTVTTDGGAGFQNSDVHRAIRGDLVQTTAGGLAYTINTQGLPPWVVERWGEAALDNRVVMEWDTTPPEDRAREASTLVTVAAGIAQLTEALQQHGLELDVGAVCTRFGVPLRQGRVAAAAPKLELVKEAA